MERKAERKKTTRGHIAEKPEKYRWKRSYTFVLVANAVYVILFYFLMTLFT